MKKGSTNNLMFMSLAIVINFIGCTLALILRLPVYLDSIGTIFAAITMGPVGGCVVGALTALINGFTMDPVSLYFIPTQVILGLMAGIFFNKMQLKGLKATGAVFLMGTVIAMVSSLIVVWVFGGVTSSGSSLIVALLKNLGVDLWVSVFVTQVVTDVLDKFICTALAFAVVRLMPFSLRQKLS